MTELALSFSGSLTTSEADLLAQCEVVIERGMGVFVEVGEALMAVRDNRLYRSTFGTFEEYCDHRWQLSRAHVNRLIDSAKVVELISAPIGAEINFDEEEFSLPATESQARELAPLLDDPEELVGVWNETVERTEGKPTAAAIREVREEREERQERQPPREEPAPVWSDGERDMRAAAEAGRIVVASLRGQHRNLIGWAESAGLYERIDRRTQWGNPFEMPADGDRATVIANYRDHYLPHKPGLLSDLDGLRGKVLGCWCAPEPCHGDVLKARAEE